jgi:hypothetical protein
VKIKFILGKNSEAGGFLAKFQDVNDPQKEEVIIILHKIV